ncbi:MAG: ATP-dependent helicase C-terminal domain-containing protein [Acidimicrobiales bacterium]
MLSGDPLELGFALARWGDPYGVSLPLLDHPPAHRLDAAFARLADLGLTTETGAVTPFGHAAATLGVHPRAAALLLRAAPTPSLATAALAAAVLDSDQYPRSDDFEAEVRLASKTLQREADRLAKAATSNSEPPVARRTGTSDAPTDLANLAAAAWPDRVALRRDETERYLLATGREVKLRRNSPLLGSEALVVVDADADATAGFVARALPLSRGDAINRLEPLAAERNEVRWDQPRGRVVAEQVIAYGSLVFRRRPDPEPAPGLVRLAIHDAVRRSNLELLRWTDAALATRARLQWLHQQDPSGWPDVSTSCLVDRLDEWLEVGGSQNITAIGEIPVASSLLRLLDWKQRDELKLLAPASLATPDGRSVAVSYESGEPVWAVRLQWLLGLDTHPTVGPSRSPITIELLSPAGRPVQRTRDLPGFWRGSYQAVRSDLRGRYPKHNWPSDPLKPDER